MRTPIGIISVFSPVFPSSSQNFCAAMKRVQGARAVTSAAKKSRRLGREFYNKSGIDLSRALLGKVLARKLDSGEILRGTIVETEAYPGPTDQASATYHKKKTDKNAALFMEPGTAYVYVTYGMYHCFNISSSEEGGAALLRAVEPLEVYDTMHVLRNRSKKRRKKSGNDDDEKKKTYELANGPGKLCLSFDITKKECNELDLCTSEMMWLEESEDRKYEGKTFEVETVKRIGIDSAPLEARNRLWRFFIVDNLAVSTAKPKQILRRLAKKDGSNESHENSD